MMEAHVAESSTYVHAVQFLISPAARGVGGVEISGTNGLVVSLAFARNDG